MKSKNGKYNMKGGINDGTWQFSNLLTGIINNLNYFGVQKLPGTMILLIFVPYVLKT